MKKTARIALVAAAAALALSACGERDGDSGSDEPSDSPTATESASETTAANPDFKACMVSDSNGFDDKSFNQTALKGQTDAAGQLGIQTAQVESTGDEQYADNINQLVQENCNEITTVGYLLGDATLAAAKANPDIDFAIVDFAYFKNDKNVAPANLQGLTYSTDQAAYLAGYLAAAQSESGVVGTFGGENIPTVTIFMEGFRLGIEKYNEDNGADVQLLGWDGKDGSFTDDFVDKTLGQAIAEQMVGQGADIIMPVAGSSGLGGLQVLRENGGKAIWVDTDGYESTEYGDLLLTSVLKGIDASVTAAIQASVGETFSNEPYNGTLENGGVGLASFHDFEAEISDETKAALEDLKAQIIAGDLVVGEAG